MTATHAIGAPVTVAFTFLDFGEGGAQRLALDTWSQLDPDRFRPALVCARGRGSLVAAARESGLPVRILGRLERAWDLMTVIALARAYRDLGAEIVHLPLYSRVTPYARLAARLAGVPLTVAQEHSRPAPPRRLRRRVDRVLMSLLPSTRFLAVSEADRDWLIHTGGVAAAQIAVLRNGIAVERQDGPNRAVAREALGLPEAAPIILVPARLHAQKRHVDPLAAATRMAPRLPGLLILCAGDGALRRPLEALTASAGLEDTVRFLGHRDDMPRLLAAADLVVLPSRIEGLPLALLEAQAAGRAVVATAVGGVPEIIEDGQTGRLVPPGQPAALAEAVLALFEDAPTREAMATRARAQVRSAHRIEDCTRQLETYYTAWLAEVNPRPAAGLSILDTDLDGGGR